MLRAQVVPQTSLEDLPKELLHCVLRGINSPETLDLSEFLAASALAMRASGHGSNASSEKDAKDDSSDGEDLEGGPSDGEDSEGEDSVGEDPEAESNGASEDGSSDSASDGVTVQGRPIGLRTWVAMIAEKDQRKAADSAAQVNDDDAANSRHSSGHISATCSAASRC